MTLLLQCILLTSFVFTAISHVVGDPALNALYQQQLDKILKYKASTKKEIQDFAAYMKRTGVEPCISKSDKDLNGQEQKDRGAMDTCKGIASKPLNLDSFRKCSETYITDFTAAADKIKAEAIYCIGTK